MSHIALGYVTVPVPGTPIEAVAGTIYANRPTSPSCHAVMFEALPTNTGLVYIGNKGFNKTTGVGVLAILGAPSGSPVPSFIPTFSAALTAAPNALSLPQYYVDADVADEGVLATALIL